MMKRALVVVWAILPALICALAGPTAAVPAIKPILQANGCDNCHAQSEQIVGPSFDAVRQKYAGQKGALEVLTSKIRLGGSGIWGQVAMPPNPGISDADLRRVLEAILSDDPPSQSQTTHQP